MNDTDENCDDSKKHMPFKTRTIQNLQSQEVYCTCRELHLMRCTWIQSSIEVHQWTQNVRLDFGWQTERRVCRNFCGRKKNINVFKVGTWLWKYFQNTSSKTVGFLALKLVGKTLPVFDAVVCWGQSHAQHKARENSDGTKHILIEACCPSTCRAFDYSVVNRGCFG